MWNFIKSLFSSKNMKSIQEIKDEVTAIQPQLTAMQEALVQVQADLQAVQDGTTTPVVTPETTEVDLVLSDGTIKKFVPQV